MQLTRFQESLARQGCYIDSDLMQHLDDGHTALLNAVLTQLEHALLRCTIHIDDQVPGQIPLIHEMLDGAVASVIDNYKDLLDEEPETN